MLHDDNQIAKDNANQAMKQAASAQKHSEQAEQVSRMAVEEAEEARISARKARKSSQNVQEEKTSLAAAEGALIHAKGAILTSEKSRKESEEARRNAELARRGAEEARGKAEEARTLAELIRDQAEAAQSYTESERSAAEVARLLAEEARKEAEAAQRLAEEALEQTRDYAQQQELLARNERLIRQIFQAVHSGKALEDVFQLIVNEMGAHLGADRCFISRYDPKQGILSAPSREYRSSEEIQPIIGTNPKLWQELSRYAQTLCAESNMPVEFDRECSGTSSEAQALLGIVRIQSGIGTSIRYQEDCLAVLFIHQVLQKKSWSEIETLAMHLVAEQIGIAIYQSELLAKEQAARKALEQSNRDLEYFATIASHDLQAPLRKIKLFSEQIYQSIKNKVNPETLDLMERVDRSVDAAQMLVSDLLSLSKVIKADRPFQMVDLSRVVKKSLATLDDQIQEKQAQIEVQPLISLMGDSQQLEQLFQNLIDNGLKYQPHGQKPVIKIYSECLDPAYYDIVVEDNGIGFKPEQAELVFQIFRRLHGKASPYSCTGVGLAICKRIVERHDGSIQVASTPGQGSRFTVRLARSAQTNSGVEHSGFRSELRGLEPIR
ncbi:ATP-binding protein [Vampirovibrio sp.]|uniref:sensor histidine kinase n=1 Tax=Vampirovibrio sp. TaxID=2717857 RepID=UPI0035943CBD